MNTEREDFEKLIKPVIANIAVSDKKYEYGINSILTAFDMVSNSALANKPEAEPIGYIDPLFAEICKQGKMKHVHARVVQEADADMSMAVYTAPPSTAALQKRIEELEAVISKKDEALLSKRDFVTDIVGVALNVARDLGHKDVFDAEHLHKEHIAEIDAALALKAGDVQAPKEGNDGN